MSETARGAVLLLSVLLWSPALRPTAAGELSLEAAALRYALALLLAWAAVTGLLRAAAPAGPADGDDVDAAGSDDDLQPVSRRADDA